MPWGAPGNAVTVQLDMSLPERFDLSYIGADNEKHRPIMIHRVVYGSIERFLGILIEHFAGKFPLWMAPTQANLLPINDDLVSYAQTISDTFNEAGIRSVVDDRAESLNRKNQGRTARQCAADFNNREQGEGGRNAFCPDPGRKCPLRHYPRAVSLGSAGSCGGPED